MLKRNNDPIFSALKVFASFTFSILILRKPKQPAIEGMIEKRNTILRSIIADIVPKAYARHVTAANNDTTKISEKVKTLPFRTARFLLPPLLSLLIRHL